MGQAAFAQVALKDTHSLLSLYNCSLGRPLTETVTVTPTRQGCFQVTMLRCGDASQCLPVSPVREYYGAPLWTSTLTAAHACALPLSSATPAVRMEQELGEKTLMIFWFLV